MYLWAGCVFWAGCVYPTQLLDWRVRLYVNILLVNTITQQILIALGPNLYHVYISALSWISYKMDYLNLYIHLCIPVVYCRLFECRWRNTEHRKWSGNQQLNLLLRHHKLLLRVSHNKCSAGRVTSSNVCLGRGCQVVSLVTREFYRCLVAWASPNRDAG